MIVSDSVIGSGRRGGVAAQQGDPVSRLVLRQPGRESGEPGLRRVARRRNGHQIAQRHRALRREVRQVHPQQLAADQVRRVVRQEVHAGDHRVHGQHQLAPRRRRQQRGIVAQVERARPR